MFNLRLFNFALFLNNQPQFAFIFKKTQIENVESYFYKVKNVNLSVNSRKDQFESFP